jgi:hypothetical protein
VCQDQGFLALLTSEFDKLGLRVGEAFISRLKADPNIGKIQCS